MISKLKIKRKGKATTTTATTTTTTTTTTDPVLMIPSYFGGFGPPARFRQRKKPEDALTYDFRLARTNLHNPKNVAESSIHLLMFALGSGLVAVHAGYKSCGIWSSLLVNVVLGCLIGYCTCILVWSAQKMYGRVQVAVLSYPDLCEATLLLSKWPWMRKCARGFRYLVETTLTLHCYGSCSVFEIMIARNLKELVEGTDTLSDDGDPPLKVYILSLMVPCAVVCMVTNLKNLAPFSLIADIYSIGVCACTVWYALSNIQLSPFDRPAFKSITGLFELIGICVFVSEVAALALPIENNMDKPKNFPYVILTTLPILTVTMMVIGFFGYWNYGETCFAPILVHFPFNPFPIQLKVFLCLVLYVTIAMSFYAGFDIEWFYIKRLHQQANYWFWERMYRSLHVALITLIAFAIPNVTKMMGIVGCLFASPSMFLYPPFLELILDWEYPGLGRFKWKLIKFIFMILLGLSMMSAGTYYNIIGLIFEMKAGMDKGTGVIINRHTRHINFVSRVDNEPVMPLVLLKPIDVNDYSIRCPSCLYF